ncbi:hypothetical protein AB0M31_33870 [Streptomyces sp. NPDC051773]|uniref:hypothetical protein n=1 Tax=Streptomyces sp. NPDC051773 TaxID=3156682 RepID=UPI00341DE6DC
MVRQHGLCDTDPVMRNETGRIPSLRTPRARRTLWTCGVVLSLGLAIAPPLLGSSQAVQLAILVGLIGLCIALLIEQAMKAEHMTAEVRTQLQREADQISSAVAEITPVIKAPAPSKQFVLDYIEFSQNIDRQGEIAVFSDIRRSKGEELLNCMRELANGAVTVSIDGPYSVRARPFDDVLLYRAVSMGPFEFWRGTFGQRYLETQHSAIRDHGLSVERIFVLDGTEPSEVEEIIRGHAALGVDTWVVFRRWVPEHHHEHVVDQGVLSFRNGVKLLMQPRATRYRQRADSERLSVLASEIRAAEFSLDIVRSNAVRIGEGVLWPTL